MTWPDIENALVWCADLQTAEMTTANNATSPTPKLGAPTKEERFSEFVGVINDTLLRHPDAYRAVQLATRIWRDGPEPWPENG